MDAVELNAHNQARLLIDGPAAFDAMFKAIEQARHTVLVHSYIIDDSALAQRLASVLMRKAAQGVAVHVLYDALGHNAQSLDHPAKARAQDPPELVQALWRSGHRGCVSTWNRPVVSFCRFSLLELQLEC